MIYHVHHIHIHDRINIQKHHLVDGYDDDQSTPKKDRSADELSSPTTPTNKFNKYKDGTNEKNLEKEMTETMTSPIAMGKESSTIETQATVDTTNAETGI